MDLKDMKPEQLATAMQLLAQSPQYQAIIQQHAAALAAQQSASSSGGAGPSTAPAPAASTSAVLPQYSVPAQTVHNGPKYTQLLAVIDELAKDIRPTYSNNRNCSERLKRGINHARSLVRECMVEIDKASKAAAAAAAAASSS